MGTKYDKMTRNERIAFLGDLLKFVVSSGASEDTKASTMKIVSKELSILAKEIKEEKVDN